MKPPNPEELNAITPKIAKWVARYRERAGLSGCWSAYLALMPEEYAAMHDFIGASIICRLAFGPNAASEALTLQAVPTCNARERSSESVSKQAGFSLPLSQASNGKVITALKTPYDDGTSHVVLIPMVFMGHLAAWVPKPRVNLTRFTGVLF